MSGFAVCKTKQNSAVKAIECCHVNVWALPSKTVNPEFKFDIGLLIKVEEPAEDEKLRIYLPFDSEAPEDLIARLDNDGANLVFGEDATVGGATNKREVSLTGSGRVYRVLDLTNRIHITEKEPRNTFMSVWDVILPPLDQDVDYYLRIRFTTKHLGRLWQRKASGLLTNGALFDLRFLDSRDWVQEQSKPTAGFELDLKKLQVFVIAPAQFQFRAVSPPLRYIRSLEDGRQWEQYLGRSPGERESEKFLIYYWKLGAWLNSDNCENGPGKPINSENPARLFLDLSRDFGYLPWQNYFRLFFLVVLILLLFPFQFLRRELMAAAGHVWNDYSAKVQWTGAGIFVIVVGAFAWWQNALKKAKEMWPWIKTQWRKYERYCYRKKG